MILSKWRAIKTDLVPGKAHGCSSVVGGSVAWFTDLFPGRNFNLKLKFLCTRHVEHTEIHLTTLKTGVFICVV